MISAFAVTLNSLNKIKSDLSLQNNVILKNDGTFVGIYIKFNMETLCLHSL
jgi:hypothetical protein